VPADESTKSKAWILFDRIVADAAPAGIHSNPWTRDHDGRYSYEPDFETLQRLLGIPLHLGAATTTGVPALALDVWIAFELRRAGFSSDEVWPRPSHPRVLAAPIVELLSAVTRSERDAIWNRLRRKGLPTGVAASSASILGKNYLKQVDVLISNWIAGPELLISTKRMDSSFGKNAANRVEESYGDAKNLRLRHPLAALGFVYGLRSTIFQESPDTAEWLIDLLQKLGKEEDAYDAVALIVIEYDSPLDTSTQESTELEEFEMDEAEPSTDEPKLESAEEESRIETALANLPKVTLRHELVPDDLSPARFLAEMTTRVISSTPVNFHRQARQRKRDALEPSSDQESMN
jgi:hypothetical protein